MDRAATSGAKSPSPFTITPATPAPASQEGASVPTPAAPGSPSATSASGPAITTGTVAADASPPLTDAGNERIADQALRVLRSGVKQGGGSVTMRLNPPELGSLTVRLEMRQNVVRAHFETAGESTRNLIHQQIGHLRTALEGQGLTVEHLQVHTQSHTGPQGGLNHQQNPQTPDEGRGRGSFQRQGSGRGGDDTRENRDGSSRGRPDFERELLDMIA